MSGAKPTEADWIVVMNRLVDSCNMIGAGVGMPHLPHNKTIRLEDVEEWLAGYEEIVPGAADLLRGAAEAEAKHRTSWESLWRKFLKIG